MTNHDSAPGGRAPLAFVGLQIGEAYLALNRMTVGLRSITQACTKALETIQEAGDHTSACERALREAIDGAQMAVEQTAHVSAALTAVSTYLGRSEGPRNT